MSPKMFIWKRLMHIGYPFLFWFNYFPQLVGNTLNKLNLIWHEAYFENYNCTFGPDAERSDNPCKIENEDENKLFLEYESFLKELGIREKSLLNMLIYKLNHPTNNLLWSKFATNLDE